MQDPPLLPDSDYPAWLWQLGDTRPPLSQLRRAKDDELSFEQVGIVTAGSAGLMQWQYEQVPSPLWLTTRFLICAAAALAQAGKQGADTR